MVDFVSPVGRIVTGSVFDGNDKDFHGQPLTDKNGNPRLEFVFGVAFEKANPEFQAFYQLMVQEARSVFPSLFDAQGNCTHPQFAWKMVDGDSPHADAKGKIINTKEGFPGHWVITFKTGFKQPVVSQGGATILTDPTQCKRGDYVRVYGEFVGNGDQAKPGIYTNFSMVEHIAYGEPINSGPDPKALAGSAAPVGYVPQGASSTPVAPQSTVQAPPAGPGTPGAPPAASAPAANPMHATAQGQPPVAGAAGPAPNGALANTAPQGAPATVQPAPGFLNPGAAPAQGAPAMAPATTASPAPPVGGVPVKYQTFDGGLWTAEQLLAAGYTQEQINQLSQVAG